MLRDDHAMRLITIPFSHYNEFARWALDWHGVAFTEKAYMPLLHYVPVALATRRLREQPVDPGVGRFATPVLVEADGRAIRDSRRIARHLDARRGERPGLYELAEAAELEQRFHAELGPHTRRVAFSYILPERAMVARLSRENVGALQHAVFRVIQPFVVMGLNRGLRLDPESVERSVAQIRREFAFADELLATRPYLAGDRFSAADMSFACMAGPGLLVQREEGYSGWLPAIDLLPEAGARLIRELRATRSGQHALRVFGELRKGRPA